MAIVPFPHNTSGDMTGVVASSEGNDRVSVTTALPGHYTLQLLHLADGEAGLLAADTAPNLAALVDAFDGSVPNTLILAGGDNFIPGPFLNGGTDISVRDELNATTGSTITGNQPIAAVDIAIHNLIGVEASTIGNHEFDLGTRVYRDAINPASGWVGAQFPYLSANLDFSGDADISGRFTNTVGTGLEEASSFKGRIVPSAVVTKGDQKIGLVGATTQILEQISSTGGVEVKGFSSDGSETNDMALLASQLQPVIDDLTAQGVNKIVLMAHLQQLQYEQQLAPLLRGVDIILAGGSNTRLGDDNDVPATFNGHSANFAGPYPIVSNGVDGGTTLIVNTDNEYTYLGRLVVDFNEAGEIVLDSLDTGINGAYPATDAAVAAAWNVAEADLGTIAFATGTKGAKVAQLTGAVQDVIEAKDSQIWGYTNVYLEGERAFVRNQESNLGNLTADANLAYARSVDPSVVVSFRNGGSIRAQIGSADVVSGEKLPPEANPGAGKPTGGVSTLDIENSLRFNNSLTLVTVTAAEFRQVMEHGLVGAGTSQGRFPQISGFSFSYDLSRPEGSRVVSMAIENGAGLSTDVIVQNGALVGDPTRTLRMVTMNFLVGAPGAAIGGDGYPFPSFSGLNRVDLQQATSSGSATFSPDGTEQDALAEYLLATTSQAAPYSQADTPPALDQRLQNLAQRVDTVVDSGEDAIAGRPGAEVFSSGIASGDPYNDSVILWTRVSPPDGYSGTLVPVEWEISTTADFASGTVVDSGLFSTTAARDWTVKVEAEGLQPGSKYYYRFLLGETSSQIGETRTLSDDSEQVRLALFSCANFPAAKAFDVYSRAAEINRTNPYDAFIILGDYIYEYAKGGYPAAEDAANERGYIPENELITLSDYRLRYQQYHTDQGLRDLRAGAPIIASWDDHEVANDSYRDGAQNHQSDTEGTWTDRRDAALQAYYEWLPIREPELRQGTDAGIATTPLTKGYRSFDFSDVLSLHMLETRLTARDLQLNYADAPPENILAAAYGDANRHMIGAEQMAWLTQEMATSSATWQVLGQQVLMQNMTAPAELITGAAAIAELANTNPFAAQAQLVALLAKYATPLQKLADGLPLTPAEEALLNTPQKIPYNLDAWDGYGVERETILQTAKALGKKLISTAGDTHNAWVGRLDTFTLDPNTPGTVVGVELATPGVTSPGLEKYLPGADSFLRSAFPGIDGLDGLFEAYIPDLAYADLNRRGFLDLTLTSEGITADFIFLDGRDPLTSQPQWISERVLVNSELEITVVPEPLTVSLSALSADKSEGNIGSTSFTFTINRSGDPSVPLMVNWAVTGSGDNPADALDFAGLALPSGMAMLLPGELSQTININVVGDLSLEADEAFTLSISSPMAPMEMGSAFTVGSSTATGTIRNDDPSATPSYSFSNSADAIDEGGLLTFGVSTTNVPAGTPVFWSFSGTGITASDFTDGLLDASSVLGSDGRTAFTKTIAADADNDPNEILELRFFSDSAHTLQVGATQNVLLRQPSVGLITDGSDILTGTAINETLKGVPIGSTLHGQGSLDRLTGGGGDDLFVLGNAIGRFYDDGTPGLGSADLALVTDFNAGDRIQLHGVASDYRLISGRYAGVAGVRIDALSPNPEAIGFVQGSTLASLNLANSSQFLFV